MKTPQQLGFKMPAEWEPHAATWLSWPHNAETWPGKIDLVPRIWAVMALNLARHEMVHICVRDEKMETAALACIWGAGGEGVLPSAVKPTCSVGGKPAEGHPSTGPARHGNIQFHHIPTNDSWIRDFGPIYIKRDSEVAMTDWIFNTWGGKWEPRPLDNAVPQIIAEEFGTRRFETHLVLEGGSIDVNGEGMLLTTESCLLSPTRNPSLNRAGIEKALYDYLCVTQVVWLKEGIAGDDTSGHIDDIARFVNAETVVCLSEKNKKSPNYEILQNNLKILRGTRTAKGRHLNVLSLPMPKPLPGPQGAGYVADCIPASYANFYIANKQVLSPIFGQETDAEAIAILKECFPGREIVAIRAEDLVWGLGGIHCVTQQQPAGTPP